MALNSEGVNGTAASTRPTQGRYPPVPRVQVFRRLDSDDFRHPLDRQNTALLRSLPGLEMVAKAVLGGPGVEQALYLENIGAAIRVGPKQLPTVYNLLIEACTCLDMEPPALYVRQVLRLHPFLLAVLSMVVHETLVSVCHQIRKLCACGGTRHTQALQFLRCLDSPVLRLSHSSGCAIDGAAMLLGRQPVVQQMLMC